MRCARICVRLRNADIPHLFDFPLKRVCARGELVGELWVLEAYDYAMLTGNGERA